VSPLEEGRLTEVQRNNRENDVSRELCDRDQQEKHPEPLPHQSSGDRERITNDLRPAE
jgi:hypothetical protein